ncbi:MAG: hemerythrin domain-containing protein, partial [Peptostreptococcaceae bacterium]
DVLFKELELNDITGPTRIMRMEHDDLRIKKRELKELLNCANYIGFGDFKERLQSVTEYLVFNLRDHIFKENTILYPTAIDSISDDDKWNDMRKKC